MTIYDGPTSGQLNVIPLTGGVYTPVAPSIDVGTDGEFCLDLNTNILYGPKDGGNTGYPWPIATQFGQRLTWQGAFNATAFEYKPGDVVSRTGTYAGRYLCIKRTLVFPQTVNVSTTGFTWDPGDYVYDSTNAYLYVCHTTTTQTPSQLGFGWPTNWTGGYPEDDWINQQVLGYAALGNWVLLSGFVDVDTNVAVGTATRWIVGDGSVITAKVADGAITTAKLDSTAGSQAVTTGRIRDNAVTDAKLDATGAVAGVYPKVTITSKGRVTSGESLQSGDIPCPLSLQPATNSTNAFRVRNAAGTVDPLRVDTTNTEVLVAQSLKVQTLIDGTATSWVKSVDGSSVLNVNTTNKRVETTGLTHSGSIVVTDTTALPSSPDTGRSNVAHRWVIPGTSTDRSVAMVFDNATNQRDILRVTNPANTGNYRIAIGDASTALCAGINLTAGNSSSGGVVTIGSAMHLPYRAISAARTLDATDYVVNCTANTFTVTLPTASNNTGRVYIIKNSGTGTITVATTSSQTIDGATTRSLATQYSSVEVMSNGTNWIVL